MNKKKIAILASLIVVIGAGIVIFRNGIATSPSVREGVNKVEQPVVSNETNESASSSGSYLPVPIDRSKLLSGKFTENRSPDGKFASHGFNNEQGDSGIYLTSSDGTEVTATYCGFFKEWSPDSKKITVFVPEECGKNVSENETFELHTDGSISQ